MLVRSCFFLKKCYCKIQLLNSQGNKNDKTEVRDPVLHFSAEIRIRDFLFNLRKSQNLTLNNFTEEELLHDSSPKPRLDLELGDGKSSLDSNIN